MVQQKPPESNKSDPRSLYPVRSGKIPSQRGLALSRRTGRRLFDFTCAWFDDCHDFEFHPQHVVHKRTSQRRYS